MKSSKVAMMPQHDLLALHLMRLHQHQQAFVGALADVQRCLKERGCSAQMSELLAQLAYSSAQVQHYVEQLGEIADQ